ncbi:MAG: EAL domain-containing protein, partial [Planctomycetaceae bacterium]|nr:EAL domain-containing protein [Planctomycetaceae bacterium]
DQTIVIANDAFCRAQGVSRHDVIGQNAGLLIRGEPAGNVREIEESLLESGLCDSSEQFHLAPDGSQRIVSVNRSLFSDQSTGERYIVATSRDITEDKSREKQLQLLASVFQCASEGAAILNDLGQIVEVNPAFAEMTRESDPRVLVGKSLDQAFQSRIEGLADLIADVRDGNPWSGKIAIPDPQGSMRSYWMSLSPSVDVHGEFIQIVALISDITELENSQMELRRRALYDVLTDLPNRAYFREHLKEHIRQQSGCTVCFLDLDNFKHVNDSSGHLAGDELLRMVGERISTEFEGDVFVARFGGDEFALIIEDSQIPPDQVPRALDGLLAAFRDPFQLGETEALVGLSIGVARFPDHARGVDALMQVADIAMYAAKMGGKNQIRTFTEEMQETVNLRNLVQTRLRDALNGGEISLHYQPQIDSQTGELLGCESLVRWCNSEGVFVPPNEFIPIAEQTGLIGPLGDIVFRKAAEQACQWRDRGLPHQIAINISPHQIRHPRFVSMMRETLGETGARAEWFELEITEHAMMADVNRSIEIIDQLAELGFRIAIDDFGTGYSSLSYLKSFRIHTLKIDMSFIREITVDSQAEAIVRSIVSLGTGLNLNVVAEGVETSEQAALLSEIGCDILQGYHIARPLPADKFVEWQATRD